MPIQNGGTSAKRIANICQRLMRTPMPILEQIRKGSEVQAAAAEESSAAMSQIEQGAKIAMERGKAAATNLKAV